MRKEWRIIEETFEREKVEQNGSRYLIANGFMGYRGTLEECEADSLVALNLAGLFDKNGESWRESVNAPNPFYIKLQVGQEELTPLVRKPVEHQQILDIKKGIHSRKTTFLEGRVNITICSERFTSMDEEHFLAMQYEVRADKEVELTLTCGIDTDIWDINGPHLTGFNVNVTKNRHTVKCHTIENGTPLVMCSEITIEGDVQNTDINKSQKICVVKVTPDKPLRLVNISGVYWGDDCRNYETLYRNALKNYEELREAHITAWERIWSVSDVVIEGDEEAQFALRYSLYHLNSIAPRGKGICGIPARGLSGQVYKGASFWDTEMFMLPFFSLTQPELAKRLALYRIDTLEGAKRKATEYGYEGAFFPWESQETGDDACTLFNVTDIFTNRPMRTYFRDKQIHVSADVVYGIWEYCNATQDVNLLEQGGLETIYQCIRFFYSYAVFKPLRDRYELLDVVGPDEYHERISNNAYTNKMVHRSLEIFLKALEQVRKENPTSAENFEETHDLSWVQEFKSKLYLPEPDENLLIEQFDDYYTLEDISLEDLRKRVIEPNEYWGGHGLASTTRILKQADVIMMLNVFRHDYTQDVKKANWEYYEPYTEHGSSLSACAYAIVAASIGYTDWAYRYFMKTATVDLTGDTRQYLGTIYIGGTHPAANGGSWNTAIFGFGGVSYNEDSLDISPNLPKHWKKMSFQLMWKGVRLYVTVTHEDTRIKAEGQTNDIQVTLNRQIYEF